jgi:hypothetical protein
VPVDPRTHSTFTDGAFWQVAGEELAGAEGGHARIAKCSCVCGGYACRQSHALACLFQFTLQFLMGSSRNNRNLSRYYLHGKKLIMDRFESVAASARGS